MALEPIMTNTFPNLVNPFGRIMDMDNNPVALDFSLTSTGVGSDMYTGTFNNPGVTGYFDLLIIEGVTVQARKFGFLLDTTAMRRFTSEQDYGTAYFDALEWRGVVSSVPESTVLSDNASDKDDFYNAMAIKVAYGLGAGQVRMVIDYDGATRTVVIDVPWVVPPDASSLVFFEGRL